MFQYHRYRFKLIWFCSFIAYIFKLIRTKEVHGHPEITYIPYDDGFGKKKMKLEFHSWHRPLNRVITVKEGIEVEYKFN